MNRVLAIAAWLLAALPGCPHERAQRDAGPQPTTPVQDAGTVDAGHEGTVQPRTAKRPLQDVVSGGGATCVIDAEGALFCRGYPPECRPVFLPFRNPFRCPPGLKSTHRRWQTAAAVGSASRAHVTPHETCVIGERGRVQCTDAEGHAGPVMPLSNIVAMIDSDNSACFLDREGKVSCVARDALLASADAGASLAPAAVTGLGRPRMLSGWLPPCALDEAGWIACWSPKENGADRGARAVRVRDLVPADEVASGGDRICARGRDGSVWCWQMNVDTGIHERPQQIEGIRGATGIAVGADHACALLGDGSVWCWGNAHLRCPTHPEDVHLRAGQRSLCPKPVRAWDLPPAKRISAGTWHSCALAADGEVYCWGSIAGAPEAWSGPVKMDW